MKETVMYYEFQASVKGFLFPTVVQATSLKEAVRKALRSVKWQWVNSRETVGLITTDQIDLAIEKVFTWKQ